MSELKATRGPWRKVSRNVNEMMMTFHGVLIGDVFVDIPTENEQADSSLISASRDLYEALDALLDEINSTPELNFGSWGIDTNDAIKALSKARGGLVNE